MYLPVVRVPVLSLVLFVGLGSCGPDAKLGSKVSVLLHGYSFRQSLVGGHSQVFVAI